MLWVKVLSLGVGLVFIASARAQSLPDVGEAELPERMSASLEQPGTTTHEHDRWSLYLGTNASSPINDRRRFRELHRAIEARRVAAGSTGISFARGGAVFTPEFGKTSIEFGAWGVGTLFKSGSGIGFALVRISW